MINQVKAHPMHAPLIDLFYSMRETVACNDQDLALFAENEIDLEWGNLSMVVHIKEMLKR